MLLKFHPPLPPRLFCTNIKRDWGPPGPSNYHPSPSSPQTTRGCSGKPCPLPRARPSRDRKFHTWQLVLGPRGWGPVLWLFLGTGDRGPEPRDQASSIRDGALPSQLRRPRRRCRRGRREGMWLFPPLPPPPPALWGVASRGGGAPSIPNSSVRS